MFLALYLGVGNYFHLVTGNVPDISTVYFIYFNSTLLLLCTKLKELNLFRE